MRIYYDSYHEGVWFRGLHSRLEQADLQPFSTKSDGSLGQVLQYDRPDVVLVDDNDIPLLVLERTIEVPSGHNVGQRFARLVAAAQMKVPVVYFAPYAAFKHGGRTAGPRFMNLRLFRALEQLAIIEATAVTTIRWPVDAEYEVMQTPEKDARVRVYLDLFFGLLADGADMQSGLMFSEFEADQESERRKFILDEVRDADQYHGPPDSVLIGDWARQPELGNAGPPNLQPGEDVVLYKIGMNKIRSDPYTGMAMLYAYLYSGGMIPRQRKLLLWMPNVPYKRWADVAKRTPNAKHIRLYRVVADGVLFADQYLPAGEF